MFVLYFCGRRSENLVVSKKKKNKTIKTAYIRLGSLVYDGDVEYKQKTDATGNETGLIARR